MGGADKTEYPPLLPAGFHKMDLAQARRLCVDRFPYSVRRPKLMDRVEAVVTKINQTSMKAEVWIDGSFCTEKLNPDDFDVVLRVLEADYRAFNLHQLSVYNWFRTSSLREEFSCDNYAFVQRANDDGTWLVAYWIRQFGFSRADEMKGLLVIETPFLIA